VNTTEQFDFIDDPIVFSRHPDPAWARRSWVSLNGTWKLSHNGQEQDIRVPFPIGSAASGVDFEDSGFFVYSTIFDYPGLDCLKRYELHIGACDYQAEVLLNGRSLGSHRGGYASFSFDITEDLLARDNRIEVRVRDSHSPRQARGKQTFRKKAWYVWYDGIAGIWQPVWIEETGKSFVERAVVRENQVSRKVEISVSVSGPTGDVSRLEAVVTDPSGVSRTFSADVREKGTSFSLSFPFEEIGARHWSPEHPVLYAISYRLYERNELCDIVESYFGLRSIEVRGKSLMLNGQRLFLRMALVQGYYPEGVYTPLSCSVVVKDIDVLKRMGFNGARIHEKIESPYFHYLCDRMGLLCSYEMPSFYLGSKSCYRAYESELREILSRDAMHPSAILWILFNETWGVWGVYRRNSRTRKFVESMVALVHREDPDRPVIENSGWEHFDTDIVDFHHYLGTSSLARKLYECLASHDERLFYGFSVWGVIDFYLNDRVTTGTRKVFLESTPDLDEKPLFLSEYGGFGWYGTEEKGSVSEKIETYTKDIVASGIFCGYCLTQLYDVGGEVNGLLSFDRKPKMDLERIKRINGA
jgi:beta-galactosidase/beta-glucuronidase